MVMIAGLPTRRLFWNGTASASISIRIMIFNVMIFQKIMMAERQELWCHDCGSYVQFDIDLELNGNHVLECPNCGHEHCRVVEHGKITDIRWDSRNRNIYQATNVTHTSTSTWNQYVGNSNSSSTDSTTSSPFDPARIFLYQSWMNS